MVSEKYYHMIEEIARRIDDEKFEKALKELSDETFEKWFFNFYLILKPIIRENVGRRRCQDCVKYPCQVIKDLKEKWPWPVKVWYESGSACRNFEPNMKKVSEVGSF